MLKPRSQEASTCQESRVVVSWEQEERANARRPSAFSAPRSRPEPPPTRERATLPKLIALWPHELDDHSKGGSLNVLAKLRRALRAERRRALAGHWSYDLNRHLGLLSAYKGELARLSPGRLKA